MKIFADKELKKEIKTINFGKVKVGGNKEVTVWLYNDSKGILTNLVFEFFGPPLPPTERIEIVEAPVTIQPGKAEPLTLKWKPSSKFEKALEVALRVTGELVYVSTEKLEVEEVIKK